MTEMKSRKDDVRRNVPVRSIKGQNRSMKEGLIIRKRLSHIQIFGRSQRELVVSVVVVTVGFLGPFHLWGGSYESHTPREILLHDWCCRTVAHVLVGLIGLFCAINGVRDKSMESTMRPIALGWLVIVSLWVIYLLLSFGSMALRELNLV